MSEAQLRRIERLNERIRAELEANHIPASKACQAITEYTENTPDPFLSFAANMKNPYLKNRKKYDCHLF
jgi:GGL domain